MPGKIRVISKAMLAGPEFPVEVSTGRIQYQYAGKGGKWVAGPFMSPAAVKNHMAASVLRFGKDYRFVTVK